MSYYDDRVGRVDGEPHYDSYFSDEDDPAEDTADLILALSGLTPRQRFVIEQRYGLGAGGQAHTLDEIAGAMGISKQSVAGIERRGLEALRRGLTG